MPYTSVSDALADLVRPLIVYCTENNVLLKMPDDPSVVLPPKTTRQHAQAIIRHTPSGQVALSGPRGKRRFAHTGILLIQWFVPMGGGDSTLHTQLSAVLGRYARPNAANLVMLTRPYYRVVGDSGNYRQGNFYVDFRYDFYY